jgi:plasmid stabilization system protein ParE
MKVVFLASCAQDLVWIRRYYESVFPEGKQNAALQFRKIRAAIAANPAIGVTVGFGEHVREFQVTRTPFSYLYRVQPHHIEILRIFDNRAHRPDQPIP